MAESDETQHLEVGAGAPADPDPATEPSADRPDVLQALHAFVDDLFADEDAPQDADGGGVAGGDTGSADGPVSPGRERRRREHQRCGPRPSGGASGG